MSNFSILAAQPIFVTGVERSGASAVAQILTICGAEVGDVDERFRNKAVSRLLDTYYDTLDCYDVKGQFPLPEESQIFIPRNWEKMVAECLEGQKVTLLKNARFIQTWKLWRAVYPFAKWIIVQRDKTNTVESCVKTAYMTAFKKKSNQEAIGVSSEEEGWSWWNDKQQEYILNLINSGADVRTIWPENISRADYASLKSTLEWAGLKWNPEIINVTKKLQPSKI